MKKLLYSALCGFLLMGSVPAAAFEVKATTGAVYDHVVSYAAAAVALYPVLRALDAPITSIVDLHMRFIRGIPFTRYIEMGPPVYPLLAAAILATGYTAKQVAKLGYYSVKYRVKNG